MYVYAPLLRTRDSELKAVSNLDDSIRDSLLPIFELTKDRITKKNKHPTTDGRFDKIIEISNGRSFILDFCRHIDFRGADVTDFLSDQSDGMLKYIERLKVLREKHNNFIPTLQMHDLANNNVSNRNIMVQFDSLMNLFGKLAVRIESVDENREIVIGHIYDLVYKTCSLSKALNHDLSNIYFILDFKYEKYTQIENNYHFIRDILLTIQRDYPNLNIIILKGNYPIDLKDLITVENSCRYLDLSRVNSLFREYNKVYKNVIYGDYLRLHPEYRKQSGGSTFIPRIEISRNTGLIISRYRLINDDRAVTYQHAAIELLRHPDYRDYSGFWFDNEVRETALGNLEKRKSPGHWIAVKVNSHINLMVQSLKYGVS